MKSSHVVIFVILLIGVAFGGYLVGYFEGTSTESEKQETIIESANFPLYLPSSDVLQPLGIASPPTVTLKYEKSCQYLEIHYYGDKSPEYPALTLHVSNGCAHSSYRDASPIELKWADGGQAMFLGHATESPSLIFHEPVHHFQYFVSSEEPLSTTLTILESME